MKTANITFDQSPDAPFSSPDTKYHGTIAATRQILKVWKQRYQGRRALRHLSLDHLRDIGISNEEAIYEADKPFWKR